MLKLKYAGNKQTCMVNRLEGSSCGRNSTKGRLLPCYQLTKLINSKLCEWCDITKHHYLNMVNVLFFAAWCYAWHSLYHSVVFVRLSVTFVYCIEMSKAILILFNHLVAHHSSFSVRNIMAKFRQGHRMQCSQHRSKQIQYILQDRKYSFTEHLLYNIRYWTISMYHFKLVNYVILLAFGWNCSV